jgi:hypothetical protein
VNTAARRGFRAYVDYRTGPGPSWAQTLRVLGGPFVQPSFGAFWRRWNPVWSWCLHEWFYAPALRFGSTRAAVMVTFAASGLVHNALAAALSGHVRPFTTVWFCTMGAVAIAADRAGLAARLPRPARPVLFAAYLAGTYRLAATATGP